MGAGEEWVTSAEPEEDEQGGRLDRRARRAVRAQGRRPGACGGWGGGQELAAAGAAARSWRRLGRRA
jgi:hypothetical protein